MDTPGHQIGATRDRPRWAAQRLEDFTSGTDTPFKAYYVSPPIGHGDLEYVNSKLLLSLLSPALSPFPSFPSHHYAH